MVILSEKQTLVKETSLVLGCTPMEVILLSPDAIRIKGKRGALVVNPNSDIKAKVAADAVILLGETKTHLSKVEGSRVTIQGAGEYEVSGIKIAGMGTKNNVVYELIVDGVTVLLGNISVIEKVKEKYQEPKVAILRADAVCDQVLLATLEPSVAVFYGEKAKDIKAAIAQQAPTTAKYAVTSERPTTQEIETVWLI